MRSVIVYATRSGNTRRVAEEIGRVLAERGDVELFDVAAAPGRLPEADLVVVGGPTEGHGVTPAMVSFLDSLASEAVAGKAAAAFDTRLAWPRVLSGSAAAGIADRLRAAGARLVTSPQSFIVSTKPELKPGELERAHEWATSLAEMVGGRAPALAPR